MMTDIDLSKVKAKRPKVAVSLSLDKQNLDLLKKDMAQYKNLTLSGVFDSMLHNIAESIYKREEENKPTEKDGDESEKVDEE